MTDIQAVGSPGASAYQVTKTAQIRMNDFLMAEYGDKVIKSTPDSLTLRRLTNALSTGLDCLRHPPRRRENRDSSQHA
jgi:hypothetical protein